MGEPRGLRRSTTGAREPVIVIIFSEGRIYATHRAVSVHKTHLKFSRQPGKVAPVPVDRTGSWEKGGGSWSAAGVVIGNIYRILQ